MHGAVVDYLLKCYGIYTVIKCISVQYAVVEFCPLLKFYITLFQTYSYTL